MALSKNSYEAARIQRPAWRGKIWTERTPKHQSRQYEAIWVIWPRISRRVEDHTHELASDRTWVTILLVAYLQGGGKSTRVVFVALCLSTVVQVLKPEL